jgi:hypothetical protein
MRETALHGSLLFAVVVIYVSNGTVEPFVG